MIGRMSRSTIQYRCCWTMRLFHFPGLSCAALVGGRSPSPPPSWPASGCICWCHCGTSSFWGQVVLSGLFDCSEDDFANPTSNCLVILTGWHCTNRRLNVEIVNCFWRYWNCTIREHAYRSWCWCRRRGGRECLRAQIVSNEIAKYMAIAAIVVAR